MDFFSIIGTVASIGSIPLSLYLYIKSKENNIDKIKRDIVKILSHQIGDRRELTTFEIQTVINSKTRESKIATDKITVNHIIEDLVSETISNPLLEKSIKENILNELKNIYFKGEILTQIDEIEIETRKANKESYIDSKLEDNLKRIIESREKIKDEIESQQKIISRTSESFAMIAGLTTIIASILTLVGKDKYDNFFAKPLYEFLQKNDFYVAISASVLAGIISIIILTLFKKTKK